MFNGFIIMFIIYKWAMFHGYVKYPEGNYIYIYINSTTQIAFSLDCWSCWLVRQLAGLGAANCDALSNCNMTC